MHADYFEDITPEPHPRVPEDISTEQPATPLERSIRNVTPPQRLRRPAAPREEFRAIPRKRRSGRSFALWGSALVAVLLLSGIAILAFRPTVVTVVPRTLPVVLDPSLKFSASPANTATSSLGYVVETVEFEDSTTVPAQGSQFVEERASGLITVFNDYSDASSRLIKNTRFETPEGLIFRVPESVVIPGRKGGKPGSISVTVVADQPGEQYNIAQGVKLTVPGLKSTPDMYKGIYATVDSAFEGGFAGERPGVAPGALERAKSDVRTRLEAKAREELAKAPTVFPEFVRIRYQSMPLSQESDGSVRITEKARVTFPKFDGNQFASTLGRMVSADVTAEDRLEFLPDEGLKAVITPEELEKIGEKEFSFTLQGSGKVKWIIDPLTVASSIAGRDTSAFETVISGFTGVAEAHAKVSPFWSGSFPKEAAEISVQIGTSTK